MLSAIVCPLTRREAPQALVNLEMWNRETPPLLATAGPSPSKPELIFSFNGSSDPELSRTFVTAFETLPAVKNAFAGIDIRFCDLPPDKDLYVRDGEVRYAPFGRKAGPNWLFYETMRSLRGENKFVFLMETDCQPIAPNWLRRLQRVCLQHDDAWVVGSHYCGVSPLHWSVARHINGNALYNIGDDLFWIFMEQQFWPWLNEYVVSHMPNLAYDCGWETYLNRVEMEHAANYDWVRARDVLQRFRLSNFIVNIGGAAEQSGDYIWTRADILKRFPGAVVVHGPLASGKDHRRGGVSLGRPTLEGGASVAGDRLTIAAHPDGAMFSRSIWLAGEPLNPGTEIAVHYTLDCPEEAGVMVTLREPNGRVIASKRRLGAGVGEGRAGRCVVSLDSPLPYVKLTFAFHGPEEARIELGDVRCKLSGEGERLALGNRILGD
ncbi:MAG: hypothetical protein ABI056_07930 [Caulobacteraceae bacterium]